MMSEPFANWPRKGDALTLLLVTLVVVVAEASIRMTEGLLSGNIAHIREMPSLVEQVALDPDSSLVIVGNSLANNGIDRNGFYPNQ